MYKIIKNNTSTMASYESKKEAYNAILSILFEITKNVPANSIEMINAKGRLDFLIDGKLFAFYQMGILQILLKISVKAVKKKASMLMA